MNRQSLRFLLCCFCPLWTLPEHESFQEQTLEVTTTCWWWPSTYAWKESASLNTQDLNLTSKSRKITMCWKPSKPWQAGSFHPSPSWTMKTQTWIKWSPPSAQLWLKQPVSSLANIVRRKNPGSLQKFLICATKGEIWERKDSSLKELRNTRKNARQIRDATINTWIACCCVPDCRALLVNTLCWFYTCAAGLVLFQISAFEAGTEAGSPTKCIAPRWNQFFFFAKMRLSNFGEPRPQKN